MQGRDSVVCSLPLLAGCSIVKRGMLMYQLLHFFSPRCPWMHLSLLLTLFLQADPLTSILLSPQQIVNFAQQWLRLLWAFSKATLKLFRLVCPRGFLTLRVLPIVSHSQDGQVAIDPLTASTLESPLLSRAPCTKSVPIGRGTG